MALDSSHNLGPVDPDAHPDARIRRVVGRSSDALSPLARVERLNQLMRNLMPEGAVWPRDDDRVRKTVGRAPLSKSLKGID